MYLEVTGEAVLIRKTEVVETQFQSTFRSRIPSLQSARSPWPNSTFGDAKFLTERDLFPVEMVMTVLFVCSPPKTDDKYWIVGWYLKYGRWAAIYVSVQYVRTLTSAGPVGIRTFSKHLCFQQFLHEFCTGRGNSLTFLPKKNIINKKKNIKKKTQTPTLDSTILLCTWSENFLFPIVFLCFFLGWGTSPKVDGLLDMPRRPEIN